VHLEKREMKNIVLPFAACLMALLGIGYSACQESKADNLPSGTVASIRTEIGKFERLYEEMKSTHERNVLAYGQEMGVTSNSTTLEKISTQRDLIEQYRLRLEYHKLQLLQADTTNQTRNENQLKELNTDFTALTKDSEIIRAGFGEQVNTRATK
jgi:hypothetical protein